MYWLYREHNILPSRYYAMGEGEKLILRAFMLRELEDMKVEE
jgi:hypothetical protein